MKNILVAIFITLSTSAYLYADDGICSVNGESDQLEACKAKTDKGCFWTNVTFAESPCTQCPAGYYCDYDKDPQTDVCGDGWYSALGDMNCHKIPEHSEPVYLVADDSDSAKIGFKCEAGYYWTGGETCPHPDSNTLDPDNCKDTTPLECQACGDGKISSDDGMGCTECTGNQIADKENNQCVDCSDGLVPNNEHTGCVACSTANTVPDGNGNGKCVCKVGYYNTGQDGETECTACGKNTYKDESGNGTCSECPTNSTTDGATGATSKDVCKCKAGYGGDASVDNGACTACDIGYFKTDIKNAKCVECPTGAITAGFGKTAKTDCFYGYYCQPKPNRVCKRNEGYQTRFCDSSDNDDNCFILPINIYFKEPDSISVLTSDPEPE